MALGQKKKNEALLAQQQKDAKAREKEVAKLLAQQTAAAKAAASSAGHVAIPQAPKLAPLPPAQQAVGETSDQAATAERQKRKKAFGLAKTRVAGNTGGLGGGSTNLGGGSLLTS